MEVEIILRSKQEVKLGTLKEGDFAMDQDGNLYCKLFVPNLAEAQPFNLSAPHSHNIPDESIPVVKLRIGDVVSLKILDEFPDF